MSKQRGSFMFSKIVCDKVKEQAKKENRSVNNMLEELVKRGLKESNK